jgi:ATP-dependent exoDNAse (exonuclease V) beta subunit
MIIFDPEHHTYTDGDNNLYTSVTTYIKKFTPQFDFDEKSKQYAAKYGMDVQVVRESWKNKSVMSTDFGTIIHEQIEKRLQGENNIINKEFEPAILQIVDIINEKFKGKLLIEKILSDPNYFIAGTADLIVDNADSFHLIDFKTNKQINFSNNFGEFMHDPISHLPNSEFFKYSLQLSFYTFFYENLTNKHPKSLCFYWLKRKNNTQYDKLGKYEWIRYNVPYLKEEVLNMLAKYGKES